MSSLAVPVANPQPNIERFLAAMDGRVEPEKPPLVEYLIDGPVRQAITERLLDRQWVDPDWPAISGDNGDSSSDARDRVYGWLDNIISFWHRLGYDFVRFELSLALPAGTAETDDTVEEYGQRQRGWQVMTNGPIRTWEDFERYPWPTISDRHFHAHEYVCANLPDGMGFFTSHGGGIFEHISRLMGFEGLCLALHRAPDLLTAVTTKVGELLLEYNKRLVALDGVAGIFQGDDMGYNTQTLISPKALREHFLPWHKRYAEVAHAAGKRYYLHSCGQVSAIMEDLIDDVRIDAKHSCQDGVFSAIDAKQKYGDRIAILGGVDMHKLSTYEPDALRAYVREIIDACAPGGRFALGAGNSIPNYVPVDNYLTMLDEALR